MKPTRALAGLLAVSFAPLAVRAAAPAGPSTQPVAVPQASSAPNPSAEKAQYNLFNPTPANLMRQMDTNRPSVFNTPHTIDAGHLQTEVGFFNYAYSRDEDPGYDTRTDTWDIFQPNFRLGVLNNVEANLAIDAYDNTRIRDDIGSRRTVRADGFGDTVVGGKWNLWGNDGGGSEIPLTSAFAIQPQFKLPTAPAGIGNQHFEFVVVFPWYINLPHGFNFGVQPGVSYQRNTLNNGYVAGLDSAIEIDRNILTQLDVYLEYAVVATAESHQEAEQTLDIGATYPLGNNIVIDSGVFIGLNSASPTLQWTAGMSFRF